MESCVPVPLPRFRSPNVASRPSPVAGVAAFAFGLLVGGHATADALPFLPPGDARVRHLLELSVDANEVPLSTTWPLPTIDLTPEQRTTLYSYVQPGTSQDAGWFLAGAVHPADIRTFDATPREKGEAGLQSGWAAGDYAGGVIRMSFAVKPADGMHYRFDDSYASWRFGNWWVSLGEQERWWGPGWDGSLILSNNARPMPSISVDRASSAAFKTPWLHWIGPWHFTTFLGRAEYQDPEFPHPLFWGARATARPLRDLEIGLSRTAQWCRVGVCGFHDFGNVLLGKDNGGANVAASQQPGNQELAWDLRWHLGSLPVAIYYQENGETADQKTPLLPRPRQTTDLIGLEFWSKRASGASWRGFVEWVGTTCGEFSFTSSDQPNYDCAYNNNVITWGYYYRDRVIGDSVQGDGRMLTLGGLYLDTHERTWQLRVRRGVLNRAGLSTLNTLAGVRTDLWSVDSKLDARVGRVLVSVGLAGDRLDPVTGTAHTVGRVYLNVSVPWSP